MEMKRLMDGAKDIVQRALEQHRARDHIVVQTAKVMSIDAANFRCNVRIAGDTTDTTRIPYNRDLSSLAVNDYVWVLIQGSRPFGVLCRINAVA